MSNNIDTAVNTKVDVSKEWQRPRLEAILFCDSFEVTSGEKTSLLGIFDRIYVHPEIRQTPPFKIFVRTAETMEGRMQITGHAPNGEVAVVVNFMRTATAEHIANVPANFHAIANLRPFHVPVEGIYWFDVFYNGQALGGAALVIEFRETEDKTGGTDTYI